MDLLAALASEREAAMKAATESGLSTRAFGVFWTVKDDGALQKAGVSPMDLAREVDGLIARFPNAAVNPDEQRRLRASLYRPLLQLPNDARLTIVETILATLLRDQTS
jgi:type I restriction enzyme R subunit